jgi:hypothetical protein
VAFDLAGSAADARRWRDQTCAVFDRQDADLRRAAAALRGDKAPTMLQLKAIAVPPNFKALLVAALARRFPEQKTELLPLARKLNVSRLPPYQLVQKAGESL